MASAAIPIATSIGSLLGGLFGNRQKQQSYNQTSNQQIDSSTTPLYDAKNAIFRDKLINMFLSRAEEAPDVSGYTAAGLNTISNTQDATERLIDNYLTARGLSRSPIAGAAGTQAALNRTNQNINFLNTIPQYQEQLTQNRLNSAMSLLLGLPTGTHTVGSETSQTAGTGTIPGNSLGGGILSLATTLAGLYGAGAFGTNKKDNKKDPYSVLQGQY